MTLFCAVIKSDSLSLSKVPFLSHAQNIIIIIINSIISIIALFLILSSVSYNPLQDL